MHAGTESPPSGININQHRRPSAAVPLSLCIISDLAAAYELSFDRLSIILIDCVSRVNDCSIRHSLALSFRAYEASVPPQTACLTHRTDFTAFLLFGFFSTQGCDCVYF